MIINAEKNGFKELNNLIRNSSKSCEIVNCLGQRFIGAGMSDVSISIEGVPGNALGAYLTGAEITVKGNAQDAVGDTMNDGNIIIHGNVGDAAGYAMRGGSIYIKGNAGYRAGIHMKAYKDKKPLIVIGGRAGSFLGEYQAGGLIIVLGLNSDKKPVVGNFPCTGMHGGKMFLRGKADNIEFPKSVTVKKADENDLSEITPFIENYCEYFGCDLKKILKEEFTVITPDTNNPYKQLYVAN